jgi:hypothetical protein
MAKICERIADAVSFGKLSIWQVAAFGNFFLIAQAALAKIFIEADLKNQFSYVRNDVMKKI